MYNHLSLLFLLNLLSLLQDFDRIVLDEEVLGVARMFREELVLMPPMTRITTDPIGMQPTASIPFGHMADLELGSDV